MRVATPKNKSGDLGTINNTTPSATIMTEVETLASTRLR